MCQLRLAYVRGPVKIYWVPRAGFGKNLPKKSLYPLSISPKSSLTLSHENDSIYLLYVYANNSISRFTLRAVLLHR